MSSSSSQNISDYEKLRLENIERNEQFLKQIGLSPSSSGINSSTGTKGATKKAAKRKLPSSPDDYLLRRSTRVANLETTVSYKEDSASTVNNKQSSSSTTADEAADDLDAPNKYKKPSVPLGPRPPPTAGTSRAINCHLDVFLSDDRLGKPLETYGKAAVMSAGNAGSEPRFNKYSGVCEWMNCVFLWVNLGISSDYKNTFRSDGRYISWFGGSKMHEESDVVKRLVKAGARNEVEKAVAASMSVDDALLLFVRLPEEGYACLGRLAHVSYTLDKHPVEFEWELLDYDRMKDAEYFRRYLYAQR